MTTHYFWLSWYHDPSEAFTLHSPWWITGERCSDGWQTICAAVIAPTEFLAKAIIRAAYDETPGGIEWRFCKQQEGSPFNDRFPRRSWMQWPEEDAP